MAHGFFTAAAASLKMTSTELKPEVKDLLTGNNVKTTTDGVANLATLGQVQESPQALTVTVGFKRDGKLDFGATSVALSFIKKPTDPAFKPDTDKPIVTLTCLDRVGAVPFSAVLDSAKVKLVLNGATMDLSYAGPLNRAGTLNAEAIGEATLELKGLPTKKS